MAQSSPLVGQFLLVLGFLAFGLAPGDLLPEAVARLRDSASRDELNDADYERMERGYYERLIDAGRKLSQVDDPAASVHQAPAQALSAPFDAGPLALAVDDLREFVLKPELSVELEWAHWTTNGLGMRDRPYAVAKPPDTIRIALVGDSIGAGWGVADADGFEPRLERALDERSRSASGPAVEVLNFAVPGHSPGQRWDNFTRHGWAMGTDLVLYEATLADTGWDERRLRGLLARGIGWDSPLYRATLEQAGVRPGEPAEAYKNPLRRLRWALLGGVYRGIVNDCRERGVPAVWVLVPRVGKAADPAQRDRLLGLARESGFSAVIDLSGAFDGIAAADLAIDPADYHPNARGHAILARRLEASLLGLPELRRRLSGPGAEGSAP